MSDNKTLQTVAHVVHAAEHTEVGKRILHTAGAAVVGTVAPVAVVAAPVLVPVAIVGAIGWGLYRLFK